MRPTEVIEVCTASHAALIADASRLTEDDVRAPSRLPNWSRAHLLTHVARNADSMVWLFEGATLGESREQYPRPGMRETDIEAGSTRSTDEIVDDLVNACQALETVWSRVDDDLWDLTAGVAQRTMAELAFRRLREVEIHHVDLDVGFEPANWHPFYVGEELRRQIEQLPDRADHVALVAWLTGRREVVDLDPWF